TAGLTAMLMSHHPGAVALFFAPSSLPLPVIVFPADARAWCSSPPVPVGTPLFLQVRLTSLRAGGDNRGTMATLDSAAKGQPLEQILLAAQVITPETLQDARARAKQNHVRLGDALVAMGVATSEDVLRALAAQQGLPYLPADELPSSPPILQSLSPKYLRQYTVCPIAVDGSTVTVATADPTNPQLLDDLRQTLGLKVNLCVAPAAAILEAIERAYSASTPLQKIVEGMGSEEATRRRARQRRTSTSSATWPSRRRS
ncbi:MAG: putative General secretion pathway protein E (Type II traffic warden ATPase), partial [Candidatus Rokubacteria bacterium]|nr:putative General secretion pathway protein E (Type II traffic warden ATPase) [Candidatus Rokubacteria bacterium]